MLMTPTLEIKLFGVVGTINSAKPFSIFCRRHFDLVSKFNVGFKSLLQQGVPEPEFYGDLVYTFRKRMYKDWVHYKCNTTDYMHNS